MYKIKNVSNYEICFCDKLGNSFKLLPGEEINNEHGLRTDRKYDDKIITEEKINKKPAEIKPDIKKENKEDSKEV